MDLVNTQSLGIAHFTVIDVPPVELVSLAAKVGFSAIGLRLFPAFPGAPVYEIPAGSEASREMQRRLKGDGVRVHDIEFVTIDAAFSPPSFAGVLEAASALGARRLSACGDDPVWPRLVANFAALCDVAAEFEMGVDVECMPWRVIRSLTLADRLVAAAARPNGGVLVDALHLSRSGGSPETVREISPKRIVSAQLCDARADPPVGTDAIILEARSQRLLPGAGHLPLVDLIAALPDHAMLSVEVPKSGSSTAEEHACQVYEATQALIARCRAVATGASRNL